MVNPRRQVLPSFRTLSQETLGLRGVPGAGACEPQVSAVSEEGGRPAFRELPRGWAPRPSLPAASASDAICGSGKRSSEDPLINYAGRHMWVRIGERGA